MIRLLSSNSKTGFKDHVKYSSCNWSVLSNSTEPILMRLFYTLAGSECLLLPVVVVVVVVVVLFCFVLFCFVLFCFVLFCFVLF